jgi:transposase
MRRERCGEEVPGGVCDDRRARTRAASGAAAVPDGAQGVGLRDWLQQEGVTHVVMESTGCYWKPVFNVLKDSVTVYLANPREVKIRKGHKTDEKDSWWLAHLLRHAMIHPSFIPPRELRELRDLTRRRGKLTARRCKREARQCSVGRVRRLRTTHAGGSAGGSSRAATDRPTGPTSRQEEDSGLRWRAIGSVATIAP